MGKTKKTTDWLGREKEEHFDDKGKKVGETRFTSDWLGNRVQEHFDAEQNKTGETRSGQDWRGSDRAEHFDTERHRVGTSRNETDWLGNPVQRHYDRLGDKVGETRRREDWLGTPFKENKGEYFKARNLAEVPITLAHGSESPSTPAQAKTGGTKGALVIVIALLLLGAFFWRENGSKDQLSQTPAYLTQASQSSRSSEWRAGGDVNRVPMAIRSQLDRQYPGWRFPDVFAEDLKTCRQPNPAFSPASVWGDFDGDGIRDYGIAIEHGKKRYTFAFVARGSSFKEFVLEPSGWNILGVETKGETLPQVGEDARGDLVGKEPVTLGHDALIGIHCESSAVAYVYTDGSFHHFFMSD